MIILLESINTPEFEAVKAIRRTVFVDSQGADGSAVFDELDKESTTHFALAIENDTPVATGRIVKVGDGYKLGRIAVLESERGKGTGKRLVEFLCRTAYDLGAKEILVDAQLHAVPFYEKLGFVPTGEKERYDIGILHLPMRKVSL